MEIVNDAMAAAIKAAEEKKKKDNNSNGNGSILASVAALQVPTSLTDEDVERWKKEAEERRSAAQLGASKLAEIDVEIAKIRQIKGWEEIPDLVEKYRKLLVMRQKIVTAGDEAFRQSLGVAQLIDKIGKTDPRSKEEVSAPFNEVREAGRGRLVGRSEADKMKNKGSSPKKVIYFGEFAFISIPSEFYEEGISPADKKIFWELGQLVNRWKRNKEKAAKERIANLKSRGNPDLCGLADGRPGFYRIYVSERRDSNDRIFSAEGVGIVEVVNLNKPDTQPFFVVRVVDGAGSLGWMEAAKRKWIPIVAVRTGRVLKDKVLPQEYEIATKLARTLNLACKRAPVLTIL